MAAERGIVLGLAALLASGASPVAGEILFREVAEAWGLDFRHRHGGSGERYMVETMVGGVVMLDFDLDGDEDVFFVDGGVLPGYRGVAPRSRLYRNEGGGRFVDFTDASGIEVEGYGCGGSAADYDGDGDQDLYVTVFGVNRLFRNRGDGTFEEVAEATGVAESRWSASAAFADPDRDGDLDLYVSNYVDFGLDNNKFCGDKLRNIPGYCHPGAYDGLPDRYYRNRGDGTFEDATQAAGFHLTGEAGLGAIFADLDDDGWPDLYVANDADPNFLFHNRGDGTFEDDSLLSGTSFSDTGRPEAGMGVDAGDVDGNGFFDIVVTNFELETNALYQNAGGGLFTEGRFFSNLAEPSLRNLGFGTVLADLDQDMDLDLVVANGHILDNAQEHSKNSFFEQPNQIMENVGGGKFRELQDHGMDVVLASRGLAAGDLDNDGDLDIAIVNSDERSEVYENVGDGGGWLQVDLAGAGGNRFGVGGLVVVRAGGVEQRREVRSTSSYLSKNATTAHFGLGGAEGAEELTVRWPRGKRQRFGPLPADRRLRLYE